MSAREPAEAGLDPAVTGRESEVYGREPIAIVGIGCRFPGADGPAAFWQLLVEGRDAVGEVPADRWDQGALYDPRPAMPGRTNSPRGGFLDRVDLFDARYFGISPGEAAAMDPQQRLALEVAVEALEDAGVALDALSGSAAGVFMGVASADYAQRALRDPDAVDMHTNAGAAACAIANRISYHLDLRGPSLVLDTACSASLVAVLTACRAIWSGECTLALAGGVNVILSPALHIGFAQALATSPAGRCAAFGEGADGMVRGEGVGIVVLKPLAQARADGDDVYAVVRGGAINQDGRTNGITAPNPAGQRALLAAACRDAGVATGDLAYVEAHGTGTPLGDPIEAAALGAVLGTGRPADRALRLGAVKSNLGHLEAAAGVAGLIKAALALRHGVIPATLHGDPPSGRIAFEALGLALQQEAGPWPAGPRVAGVSAFGFAGTNCHVILEHPFAPGVGSWGGWKGGELPRSGCGEAFQAPRAPSPPCGDLSPFPAPPRTHPERERVLVLPLSARDPAALAALARRLHAALAADPALVPADVCHTALRRRAHLPIRRAIAAADRDGLLARLADVADADPTGFARAAGRARPIVFLYPGMGAQRAGMGRELLAEPAFRAAVAEVDAAIAPFLAEGELGAWSLLDAMASDGGDARWQRGDVAQPLQFALQVGLTALLRSWGVTPTAVVGGSLGEIAAAWAAGGLTLDDACRVVARRARIMQTMAGAGTVAAVALSEAEALAAIAPHADRAWIAAVNGPRQTLLAGEQAALEAVVAAVEEQGGFARLVRGTLVASHSPVVEPLREDLLAALADVVPRPPVLPMWSTVIGGRLAGPLDAAYWWANMRRPVRLAEAVAAIAAAEKAPIVLELSAHPALAPAVADVLAERGAPPDVIGVLRRDRAEPLAAREAAGALWALGAVIDWDALVPAGEHVHLPTYPWRRERHWLEERPAAPLRALGAAPIGERVVPASGPGSGAGGGIPGLDVPGLDVPSPGLDAAALRALPRAERLAALRDALTRELGRLLDVAAVKLDPEAPLTTLGVGSLVGMELNNRVRRDLGVALPMALLLEGPSLARLAGEIADRLAAAGEALPPPTAATPRPAVVPASFAQRRMWFLERLAPGAAGYQVAGAMRLRGPLDRVALGRTLDAITARHEALRTSLPEGPDGPVQAIAPPAALPLPLLDLAALPADVAEAEARARLVAEASRPFDLAAGPLFRASLIRLTPEEHLLGVTLHHAIGDGWSLAVLMHELAALYPVGDPTALPALPLQYADYAIWQQATREAPALDAQLAYWRERLAGAPARLALPTDHPRPAARTGRGATLAAWLPPAAVAAADTFGRTTGATRFMVALTAFLTVLGRWSGQDDLCVGTPISGRHHPGLEPLIGCFLNMLVVRGDLAGDPTFGELAARVRRTLLDAMANQDVPFERLVEALAPVRDLASSPLFQVAFAWHAPLRAPVVAGLVAEPVEVDPGTARFDLAFGLHETDAGVRLIAEYDAALWEPATVRALMDQFTHVLAAGANAPDTPLGALALGPAEAEDAAPAPPAIDLLAGVRAAPADAPAVVDGDTTWTYGDLLARAGALAGRLVAAGAGPGVPVAIVAPRSAELVLAHLATAIAGAIAAPLDPAQPAARLAAMATDLGAPVALVAGEVALAGPVIELRAAWHDGPAGSVVAACDAAWAPAAPAYLIFTSGSTGRPKGVVVSAGGRANLVGWHLAAYGLAAGDRVALVASPGFDASVWEIWPALAAGATLVVAPDPAATDPDAWPAWLVANAIAVAFLPTALAEHVLGLAWPTGGRLRALLTGGDRLNRRPAQGLPFRVVNHYGPTEAAVVATAGDVAAAGDEATAGNVVAAGAGAPAIGRAIAGVRVRVADAAGRAVPAGAPGELWVGGAGVALGYWRDEALTAARFVELPGDGRWYRTGDRARRLPDGALAFLGRVDAQVQVRGVRVEPGEVEGVLASHPAVAACAVAAKGDPERLVAYVVLHPLATSGAEVPAALAGDAEEILPWLAAQLPAAMVPAALVLLTALPLSSAGKVDRRALPEPPAPAGVEQPVDDREAAVEALWADVLGVPVVGRRASFFALGGHSLLAWRLITRVRDRFGVELPLAAVFADPTVAGMARAIASAPAAAAVALLPDPAAAHQPFPLTPVQAAYWVGRDASLTGGGVAAHAYVELDVPGLDLQRLRTAVDALVARHPMLRAVVDDRGRQRVLPAVPPFPLEEADLRPLAPADRAKALADRRSEWSHEVRPADRWPLLALRASRLPDEVVRLHLGLDALVADAASLGILARELDALYRDPRAELGSAPTLAFRDYVLADAAREASGAAAVTAARDWWRMRLPALPEAPELPLAPTPPDGRPTFVRRSGGLTPDAWARFRERAAEYDVSPTAAVLAAFGEVLAAWARRPAFTLNLPTFRRLPLHPDVERVVGDFTTLTPLALDHAEVLGFGARCRTVQARLWEDLDHADAGGLWVMREWARQRGEPAAFPVVFTSVLDQGDLGASPLGGELVHALTQTPQVVLDHQVMQLAGGLAWHWDAVDGHLAPGVLDALAAAYDAVLTGLAAPEATWERPVAVALPAADARAIAAANSTAAPMPAQTLHMAFLARAAERPDAPAVIAPDRTLDYATLRAEASALAARLGAAGLGPGRPVALLVDRGWEPVVGVLAASLAGVPWVPIDPAAPPARRAQLLALAGAGAAVVRAGDEGLLAEVMDVAPLALAAGAAEVPLPQGPAPAAPAYVVFTSGSTGEPKGVVVAQRAAANTIVDVNADLGLGPADRVLALSAPGFDLAVWDVFGPLAAGAAVVTLAPGEAREPAAWAARMAEGRVTVWNSAPPLMAMLLAHAEGRADAFPAGLRAAMLSGDWVPVDMPGRIRAHAPGCRVVALGGATEAAIWSIREDAGEPAPGWTSVPYGRPMANQAFHVRDERGRSRPLWAEGDLYIGGAGVAEGYWRDPARTAAAFVVDAESGERRYRTGDRGRWRPAPAGDGVVIEFLGREDDQVKVRGVRIELGEIEAALAGHPAVREAAVVAVGDRHARRLVAFVVGHPEGEGVLAWLAARLPEALVPTSLHALDALPLTPNGKVDRRALTTLAETTATPSQAADPAADPALVTRLAAMAAEALGLPSLDPRADLLALGVASIELVRLANRLEEDLGARPAMAELLGMRTIEAVAAWYAAHGGGAPRPTGPRILLDPAEREAFKNARPGLRTLAQAGPPVQLAGDASAHTGHSARVFGPGPISLSAIGALLAGLRAETVDGRPKLRYGSAGALYPVQVHLQVRPDAVTDLPGGTYYHHPDDHRLVPIRPGAAFDPDVHVFMNRAIADGAAFAIYLIGDLDAIAPVYGEAARDLALLEAGAIAQILREAAPPAGLGLCAVGAMDFGRVAPDLALGPRHVLALALLGGAAAADVAADWTFLPPAGEDAEFEEFTL